MAQQALQIQWLDGPRITKRYVYNGLGIHGSPNLTNTMVWLPMAHQALHIQWCGGALFTKPYKYISLNIHGSPDVTYPKVCDTWLTKPYKYNCFWMFALFFQFSKFSMFSMFSMFFQCFFLCFPGFQAFPCFPFTAYLGSVAGARLTACPEMRFMRCAVHGSNLRTMRVTAQLSKKPSYQRWTRLQPMLETQVKS